MSERRIARNLQRRRVEIRRNIEWFLFTFILIGTLTIVLGSFTSKAESQDSEVYNKYYSCIEIQANDSLWTIANQYKETHYKNTQAYIDEVMAINNMKDDTIIDGEYLIIPYYAKEIQTNIV